MDILGTMGEGFLLFDGALGTMLQQRGLLNAGELPELLNITNPQEILEIHKKYVNAGADVVTTNTFGANNLKLSNSGNSTEEVISAAVAIARSSGARFVALGIGPTGKLLYPSGDLSFEDAYDLFAQQVLVGKSCGVDAVLIETMSDLLEAKTAVLAVRENSSLPVFCTMTFEEDGRTFLGTDAVTAAATLSALGVDALGVNCSLGPDKLMGVVTDLLENSRVPVMVQANAGIPGEVDGCIHFNINSVDYCKSIISMVDKGVRIVGGCCGTTPEYIADIRAELTNKRPVEPNFKNRTIITSSTQYTVLDGMVTVIGERINPTGKKLMKQALLDDNMDYIIDEAIGQTNAGANILDVNVGLPQIDEVGMLRKVVCEVSQASPLPLQIDSTNPAAIEAATRSYSGIPIINSCSGETQSLNSILPIAQKYGAALVCLTLDENGIPETAEGRVKIAGNIIKEAATYGISKDRLLIDCLVLTASAQQEQVIETLKAIKMVKEKFGVKTVLGVSNVSFGLPNRPLFTSHFLSAALGAGLDSAIINPMSQPVMQSINCFKVINNQDRLATNYIANTTDSQPQNLENRELTLYNCIVEGRDQQAAKITADLIKTMSTDEIIKKYFMPALEFVGSQFQKGKLFLPQLMQSAIAAAASFDEVKRNRTSELFDTRGTVVIATVKGDVHDIGKNIVKMMLENYGFEVIDLGRDVPPQRVVDAAISSKAKLIGLSALMTTTVESMRITIESLKTSGCTAKVMVGGAVLNEEYAKIVGADYYSKDALGAVEIANKIYS